MEMTLEEEKKDLSELRNEILTKDQIVKIMMDSKLELILELQKRGVLPKPKQIA